MSVTDNTWNNILFKDIEELIRLCGPQTLTQIKKSIGEDPMETQAAIDYGIDQGWLVYKKKSRKFEIVVKFKPGEKVTMDYEDNPRGAKCTDAEIISGPEFKEVEGGYHMMWKVKHLDDGFVEEWAQQYLIGGKK